jgi:hypothetical protein
VGRSASLSARFALLATAAAAIGGCAEITAILTPPEKPPLFQPELEKPKAVVFLELDGAMVPFLCGGDGAIARDKACAGRVPVGSQLQAVTGEGLLVEKAAYRDCGAAESIEASPKPSLHTVALWSADGRASLEKPRDASALPTAEWQRLSPKLAELAAKDLGATPGDIELLSWLPGEFDGHFAPDLLLAVEAKPSAGEAEAYRAVVIESGMEKRPFFKIASETKRREPPLDLITAVDVDGDRVMEIFTGGDVWSVSKSIQGKPTDIASWYCYKPRPPVPPLTSK